jgi:hypothetical protein
MKTFWRILLLAGLFVLGYLAGIALYTVYGDWGYVVQFILVVLSTLGILYVTK